MIRIDHLTKRFGKTDAVRDVSFVCEQGSVTGFLGPNGAGKSTTLRMLTGLTPPTAGTATINGVPYHRLPNPGRAVGVMLDASAQHPGRTGRETVRLAAALLGVPDRRADALLEYVGLASAAKRRVRDYSLGMRQRLGIAVALLGDPVALVLDEPANGMDPEGIRWMRGLLRDFAAAGGTVLLSSHLLREVEATVDRLVVIGAGQVRAQGSLDELLGDAGVVAGSPDLPALGAALERAGLPTTSTGNGALRVTATAEQVAQVALDARVLVTELREARDSGLEDLFFALTTGSELGNDAGTGSPAAPTATAPAPRQEISA